MAFIVLYGKFLLHSETVGPIGTVKAGDSLGEEGLFEKRLADPFVKRDYTATAEEESYIIEISQAAMEKLKANLFKANL